MVQIKILVVLLGTFTTQILIMKKSLLLLGIAIFSISLFAQDQPDEKINEIIRKHGLEESKVMETASWMMDVYGPRLTGSPN